MIVLSAGMQKAGSAWFFNILNDLCVAAGYKDARAMRREYHLQRLMTEVNCNVGRLDPIRLALLCLPHWLGNTFVIKTHAPPNATVDWLMGQGIVLATYIYRDPRDVARSLLDHSERIRRDGIQSSTTFDRILTMDQAIEFTAQLLPTWEAWVSFENVWTTSYERLRENTRQEVLSVLKFLNFNIPSEKIAEVVEQYQSEKADGKRTHMNKAEVGRWRSVFTPDQIDLSRRLFGDYIERMGYSTV